MKAILSSIILCLFAILNAQDRNLEAESKVVTTHKTSINGDSFDYTATTGTQPVWDDTGKVIASLFYTYYERQGITDRSERPLLISFNGGPGSASVWMHVAYTGPMILNLDEEGFPIQPYGVRNNPNSVLDIADIVFVNPVNTAYSRIMDPEVERETFFGINADIKYLADWINTFVTRNERWTSPKFLIGESYGTTRVSGLALELQNRQWMYLNGVILVSPTELGLEREGIVESANRLPYYTAVAWYHNALPESLQKLDLLDALEISERYAIDSLLPALARGGFLSEMKKNDVADRMSYFSGITSEVILQHNLDVPTSYFWKELLRDQGFTVGRLDSRYKGIDLREAGERPDYNSEITSWLHSFTPAINHYIRTYLKYETDVKYNMFGPVRPWDRSDDNTGRNLRQAMAQNPFLNVMIQSGYFDGATSYFDAKYTMWHLDPSGKFRDRISFKGYESGHMMYLRWEDLITANDDLRRFIKASLPEKDEAAKY